MLLKQVISALEKASVLPGTFCGSQKRAAALKVQMDPFMHNISSPPSFFPRCSMKGAQVLPWFSPALFPLFPGRCSSRTPNGTSPTPVAQINLRRLSNLRRTSCSTRAHAFISRLPAGAQYTQTYNLELSLSLSLSLAICRFFPG